MITVARWAECARGAGGDLEFPKVVLPARGVVVLGVHLHTHPHIAQSPAQLFHLRRRRRRATDWSGATCAGAADTEAGLTAIFMPS